MANEKTNVFTQAMRSEFITQYSSVAEPAPVDKIYQQIPSTTRFENYAWLSPAPGVAEWKGHRRFGKISEVKYKVENKVFDGSFEVLVDDVNDDQTGGYKTKAQELAIKCQRFPGKEVLRVLAAGGSTTCFDGTNFFANSHTIGTGDNTLTGNFASNDGLTHVLIALVVGGPLKPVFWQEREAARLDTDAGTPTASQNRILRYWAELRGNVGLGYWWDGCHYTLTDTPTIAEMQGVLGEIEQRFRGFQLPSALPGDPVEYVHEQIEFNDRTLMLVCSTGIAHIVRQVLSLSLVSNTDNPYKGYAGQVTSALLNP